MAGGRRSILIDARVNGFPGAHGLARSVMKLVAHMSEPGDGLALRVLVNPRSPQIFPLSELPAHADVIGTDVTVFAPHRCWELARLIRAVDAAVLYVPYPTFTPLIRPCPFVVTVHDCTIETNAGFAGNGLRQTAMRTVTRMALRQAAAMTAPSRASLAEICHHYPAAPNPTLIPNGVDVRQFGQVTATAVATARGRYQLPTRFILTVGARRPHKNHEVLVRALAAVPGEIGLVIVGSLDARFRDPLPSLIAELGLESRVTLVPDVAEEWLPAVYRAASVFAFPSLAEGYGIPVLEAMAAGVPVVMSNIQVLAEVAGSAALMVPPHDVTRWASTITAVLLDPALSGRLTEAGSAVAAAASWEHGASSLGRLLSAVAGGHLTRSCVTSPALASTRPLAAAGYSSIS
jgi:glycosyltransferase involved in cell wall biosynthesis